MPWRTAVRFGVVHALRAGQGGGLVLQDHAEHLQPGPDGERQQSLLELTGQLADGHGHGVGQGQRRLVRLTARIDLGLLRCRPAGDAGAGGLSLIVLLHGGPLLGWMF